MKPWMKFSVILLAPFMVAAAPGSIQFDGTQTEEQQVEEEDPNERICRRVRTTGTNLRRRYCMTRAEWTSLSRGSNEDARARQDDSLANGDSSGTGAALAPLLTTQDFVDAHGDGRRGR